MYITFDDYKQLYDPIEERVFNLLVYDACRMMDIHTTLRMCLRQSASNLLRNCNAVHRK